MTNFDYKKQKFWQTFYFFLNLKTKNSTQKPKLRQKVDFFGEPNQNLVLPMTICWLKMTFSDKFWPEDQNFDLKKPEFWHFFDKFWQILTLKLKFDFKNQNFDKWLHKNRNFGIRRLILTLKTRILTLFWQILTNFDYETEIWP